MDVLLNPNSIEGYFLEGKSKQENRDEADNTEDDEEVAEYFLHFDFIISAI